MSFINTKWACSCWNNSLSELWACYYFVSRFPWSLMLGRWFQIMVSIPESQVFRLMMYHNAKYLYQKFICHGNLEFTREPTAMNQSGFVGCDVSLQTTVDMSSLLVRYQNWEGENIWFSSLITEYWFDWLKAVIYFARICFM